MTDNASPPSTESTPPQENLSLAQLLSLRIAYERSAADIYGRFVEQCSQSKDPIVRAMNLSPFESMRDSLTEHIHLLAQAIDVIGGRSPPEHDTQRTEAWLTIARATQAQAADVSQTSILPCMEALLAIEQCNEVAWGLLLALIKDAELHRFVAPIQQACDRHSEQRSLLQHDYEDVVLGLVRRSHAGANPAHPARHGPIGRAGLFAGNPRYLRRI